MKFDVEGAEHDALVGGARTIREAMPVMAICLYHRRRISGTSPSS